MKTLYFNIHDFILLEWSNPLWSAVPQFACKYNYFKVSKSDFQSSSKGKVTLSIQAGKPPASLLKSIIPSAERFGIGDDIMEIKHQHGWMKWTSWISGIESDNPKIWYHFPLHNRLQWPWITFPDHIICFHVVQPIIEYKLLEKDIAFIHAGAAAKNGESFLLAGRGGVKKTSYLMHLLKNGWEYLADDLVILRNGKLYSYPMCDTFFDYFFKYKKDETIDFKAQIGAFWHVRKNLPISFKVSKPAAVKAVNFLVAWNNHENKIKTDTPVNTEAIDKILASNRLERLNFVDLEEAMGRFLLQLNQVNGHDNWNIFWSRHRQLLEDNLLDLPYREILSCGNIKVDALKLI